MVGYAYVHRGSLPQEDVLWLRRQLGVYGPVPVAPLFGPTFTAYVANPAAIKKGDASVSARMVSSMSDTTLSPCSGTKRTVLSV